MAHTNRSKRLCWAQFLPEIGEQRLAEMARIKELEALRGRYVGRECRRECRHVGRHVGRCECRECRHEGNVQRDG